QRERFNSLGSQLGLDFAEYREPSRALLRLVPPVPCDRRTRALTSAHKEEPAPFATACILGRLVKRQIALEALAFGGRVVDTVLVYTAALTALALPVQSLHGLRGIRITRLPDALCLTILPEQQEFEMFDQGQRNRAELLAHYPQPSKGVYRFVGRKRKLLTHLL